MPTTAVLAHDCENPLASTNLFRVGMAATLEDVIHASGCAMWFSIVSLGRGSTALPGLGSTAIGSILSAIT